MGQHLDELNTALFSSSGRPLWKFPVVLIRNAKADEFGNIWFILRNVVMEDEFRDAHFFVQLQFYNKELCYYLRVEGDATVASGASGSSHISPGVRKDLCKDEFLIKLRVCQAKFYNKERKQQRAIL